MEGGDVGVGGAGQSGLGRLGLEGTGWPGSAAVLQGSDEDLHWLAPKGLLGVFLQDCWLW